MAYPFSTCPGIRVAMHLGYPLGMAAPRDPKALLALYRCLPALDCTGKCWGSCGPVEMSPVEEDIIDSTYGRRLNVLPVLRDLGSGTTSACPALNAETKRCEVYAKRPMICRLWGRSPSLRCPYGCEPEGGLIDDLEMMRLLYLSMYYGGAEGAPNPEEIEQILIDPRAKEIIAAQLAKAIPVAEEAQLDEVTVRIATRGGRK
jgi:Fe-S-cluster containining protein